MCVCVCVCRFIKTMKLIQSLFFSWKKRDEYKIDVAMLPSTQLSSLNWVSYLSLINGRNLFKKTHTHSIKLGKKFELKYERKTLEQKNFRKTLVIRKGRVSLQETVKNFGTASCRLFRLDDCWLRCKHRVANSRPGRNTHTRTQTVFDWHMKSRRCK